MWKEYVQDIAGSVAFAVTASPVQPGIPTLFAWLANQAIFYQEYRFKKLNFCFETEKGSSTSGKVMFAFQEDATDAVPSSKQEMLENQWKASAAPWEPFRLSVPTSVLNALGPKKYIRSGTLAANLDLKTYDVGQLLVATLGMSDTTVVGELYVEYEVELITPIQSTKQLASILSKTITGAGSVSDTAIFGTAATSTSGLDVTASASTLTFNRVGWYLVEYVLTGTGLFTTFVPVTSSSTVTIGGASGISNAAANVGTTAFGSITILVTARGQTLVIDVDTQATTVSASTTRVAGYTSVYP
jgi:hypothetical protein